MTMEVHTSNGDRLGSAELPYFDDTPDEPDTRQERDDDKVRFEGVSCRELANGQYDVEFLIEDTLVEGQPCMIGAAPKSLKTIIAIDAAISLATATPFLGMLEVRQARTVGFMSGEGGLAILQDYASRVAVGRGMELADVGKLYFCNDLPQLADLRHLDALEEFILDHEIEIVIIDPLYLCMPADDAGNILRQGKILRNVNRVCLKHGVTPLMVHHTKKNVIDPYAPAELSDLSWSGFSEFAGQWWLLSRRAKYDADQPGEHALWLNIGGRTGHSSLRALDVHEGTHSDFSGRRWEVEVGTPREARECQRGRKEAAKQAEREERLEADQKQLVRTMAKLKAPESKNAIRDMAGLGNGRRFEETWGSLIQDGSIVKDGMVCKTNNQRYDAFRLEGSEVEK